MIAESRLRADLHHVKGKAHHHLKDYKEAIDEYQLALNLETDVPTAFRIMRAMIDALREIKNYSDSLRTAEKALRFKMTDVDRVYFTYWQLLALVETKQFKGIQQLFYNAIHFQDKDLATQSMLYNLWGTVLASEGRYKDARSEFEAASKHAPPNLQPVLETNIKYVESRIAESSAKRQKIQPAERASILTLR